MSNDFLILPQKVVQAWKCLFQAAFSIFPAEVLAVSNWKNVQSSQCSAYINPKNVLSFFNLKILSVSVFQHHYYTQSLKQ